MKYPHRTKYATQTSKKKPHRNCHPKACAEPEECVENNPVIKGEGQKRKSKYVSKFLYHICRISLMNNCIKKETSSTTNNVIMPNIMTGFRPYRSAIAPQRTEVKALPNIYADPSRK